MRSLTLFLAVLTAPGCVEQPAQIDPATDKLREVKRVALAPTERLASSSSIAGGFGAQTIGVFEGRAAIGTSTGLLASNTNALDALAPVQTLSADGGLRDLGEVVFVGRRGTAGTLVLGDQGLFHDRSGVLLEAPLSESLRGRQVFTVDSFGAADAEELWLLSPEGVLHVGGGELRSVSLTGVGAKPEAVLANGANGALLIADGSLYEISLAVHSAVRIGEALGNVASFERGEDGTAYFATDDGLLEVSKSGELRLHTFAPPDMPGLAVSSVAAAAGLVIASTDTDLFSLESSGAVRIAAHSGVLTRGLAIDGAGDTFAATATTLRRFKTGLPASFAADVKPFFSAHCMACHRAGLNGARTINFEDYETAKLNAGNVLNRLNAIGISPMPPATSETLSAADYAVVTRWVGGGMAP